MDNFIPEWAELPNELVQKILHHAAHDSVAFCRQLSLVASWTRLIAAQHLYHTTIASPDALVNLALPEDDSTVIPIIDNLRLIHNCWLLKGDLPQHPTCHWLRIGLTNLERVSLDLRDFNLLFTPAFKPASDVHITFQSRIRTELSFRAACDRRVQYKQFAEAMKSGSAAMTKVTHIRFVEYELIPRSDFPQLVTHFSRLTHLAVPVFKPGHSLVDLGGWALGLPSLQVLVIIVYEDLLLELADRGSDLQRLVHDWIAGHACHRVRVGLYLCRSDTVQQEWEEESRGGLSIWEKTK